MNDWTPSAERKTLDTAFFNWLITPLKKSKTINNVLIKVFDNTLPIQKLQRNQIRVLTGSATTPLVHPRRRRHRRWIGRRRARLTARQSREGFLRLNVVHILRLIGEIKIQTALHAQLVLDQFFDVTVETAL